MPRKTRKKTLVDRKIVEGIVVELRGPTPYFICPFCKRRIACRKLVINDREFLHLRCRKCDVDYVVPNPFTR